MDISSLFNVETQISIPKAKIKLFPSQAAELMRWMMYLQREADQESLEYQEIVWLLSATETIPKLVTIAKKENHKKEYKLKISLTQLLSIYTLMRLFGWVGGEEQEYYYINNLDAVLHKIDHCVVNNSFFLSSGETKLLNQKI